jgi:hypothetical protein
VWSLDKHTEKCILAAIGGFRAVELWSARLFAQLRRGGMRFVRLMLVGLVVSVGVVFLSSEGAQADFHCLRIHAVGYAPDTDTKQFVELRMSASGQPNISGHVVRFYDASIVLKGTFTFPTDVSTSSLGDSILIGSQEFNNATEGGDADFLFAGNTVASNGGDPGHPIQRPGGRVVYGDEPGDFNCNGNASLAVDAVAYGGGSGGFGTPAPESLPLPPDNQVLRLGNLNAKPSNNDAEYALATVSATTFTVAVGNLVSDASTPRNNANVVLRLVSGVGGVAGQPEARPAPAAAPGSSGSNGETAALAAGAAIALAVLAGTGVLLARRRRSE